MQLTINFSLQEFLSKGDGFYPSEEIIENLKDLARELEIVRSLTGKPIIITSGYRGPSYNKQVGGSEKSKHLLGKAADIVVKGQTPKETQERLKNWPGGLGCYDSFTHIDIRKGRVRW